MALEYAKKGKVNIYMRYYFKHIINYFNIKLYRNDTSMTPTNDNLFKKCNRKMLSKDKSEIFHTITEKCMFLCKITRPEIQPTIEILCIIAKNKNERDTKKLIRMMKYFNVIKKMVLTLSYDNTTIIKWYTNGAFCSAPKF